MFVFKITHCTSSEGQGRQHVQFPTGVPQVWFALGSSNLPNRLSCAATEIVTGTRDLRSAGHVYSIGMVSFSTVMSRENVPAFNKFPVNEYILSCPKSWFGFSHTSYRKTQMNFLANPRYQVPSRADARMEAKEDRQGFCSFGMILSTFR